MKRNRTNCRHSKAYPTMLSRTAGFLWCPDCGAHRLIRMMHDTSGYQPAGNWIYPTGHNDVIGQLEKQERQWK